MPADVKVEFNFLEDIALNSDEFSGGGHGRSAKALIKAIEHFSGKTKNHSIGLKGGWGSGKSTVIEIAKKELERTHSFFIFDLWQNQNLNFRRAFLEALLDWAKRNFPPAENYTDIEDRIKGKTETVKSHNERTYSWFAYALFLASFVWIALSFFKNDYDWFYSSVWSIIIFVAVAFLAQVVLYCRDNSFRVSLDKTFSLINNKSKEETVRRNIREGDPTQYEFRALFFELLALIRSVGNRPIVIVFDNIDRLPVNQIADALAEVRAAIAQSAEEDCTHFTSIIPYDKNHILKAFYEDSDAKEITPEERAKLDYERTDILRKSFNVNITVAAPIASDLKSFFSDCIQKADLSLTESQIYNIFNIFDTNLTEIQLNPTPRQVKSFINDFSVLWAQWFEKLAPESIAVFLIYREKLETNPKNLQNSDFIDENYKHYASPDLYKELAALAYNIEPDRAYEILLGRDIKSAIASAKPDELSRLIKSPGFKEQYVIILQEQMRSAEIGDRDYGFVLANYLHIKTLPDIDKGFREDCDKYFLDVLAKKTASLQEWQHPDKCARLVELMPENELKLYMSKLMRVMSENIDEKAGRESGEKYISLLNLFLKEIEQRDGKAAMLGAIDKAALPELKDNKGLYIGMAIGCAKAGLNFSEFDNGSLKQPFHEELSALSLEYNEDFVSAWNSLVILTGKEYKNLSLTFNNKKVAGILGVKIYIVHGIIRQVGESNLSTPNSSNFDKILWRNLIKKISFLLSDESATDNVTQTLSDLTRNLQNYVNFTIQQGVWKSFAHLIWIASFIYDTPQLRNLAGGNNLTEAGIEAIADLIIKYEATAKWLNQFEADKKANKAQDLYQKVLANIFSRTDNAAMTFEQLNENFQFLNENFESELDNLINRTCLSATDEEIQSFDIFRLNAGLYQKIYMLNIPIVNSLSLAVDKHIENLTKEQWSSALLEGNDWHLVIQRAKNLKGKIPATYLAQALIQFVIAFISNSNAEADNKTELNKNDNCFFELLNIDGQRIVSKAILAHIKERSINITSFISIMDIFPGIYEQLPITSAPVEVTDNLLIPMIGENSETAITYIEKRSEAWQRVVKKLSESERGELATSIAGVREEERDRLYTMLNMEKPPLPTAEKKETEKIKIEKE